MDNLIILIIMLILIISISSPSPGPRLVPDFLKISNWKPGPVVGGIDPKNDHFFSQNFHLELRWKSRWKFWLKKWSFLGSNPPHYGACFSIGNLIGLFAQKWPLRDPPKNRLKNRPTSGGKVVKKWTLFWSKFPKWPKCVSKTFWNWNYFPIVINVSFLAQSTVKPRHIGLKVGPGQGKRAPDPHEKPIKKSTD